MAEKKLWEIFFIFPLVLLFFGGYPSLSGNCQSGSTHGSEISITGRLYLERHGSEDWLILHGSDRKAYLVSGALKDTLTNIALQKKDTNIVELSGLFDPDKTIRNCDSRNDLEYNAQGEKIINRKTFCIRYYYFEAQALVSCADSDKALPALERDTLAESQMQVAPLIGDLKPAIIGEIYGTIRQVNLRSPVKTVEIRNTDKNSELRSITVIITSKTRLARAVPGKEPVLLLPENLKAGQQVVVMYDRNEVRTEALSIAVTK